MLLETSSAESRRRRNLAHIRVVDRIRAREFERFLAQRHMEAASLTPEQRAAAEQAYRREISALYRWILLGNGIIMALLALGLVAVHVRWPWAVGIGACYFTLATLLLIRRGGPSADMRAYFLQHEPPPPPPASRP